MLTAEIITGIAQQLKNNVTLTPEDLELLNLRDVSEKFYYESLVKFLTSAYMHKNDNNITNLIEHYQGFNLTDLHIMIYIIYTVPDEKMVRYILALYDNVTYVNLLTQIINYDSRPIIIEYINKIEEYFPEAFTNEIDWEQLYEYARSAEIKNEIMEVYLLEKMKRYGHKKAKKPAWILRDTFGDGSAGDKGSAVSDDSGAIAYTDLPSFEEAMRIIAELAEEQTGESADIKNYIGTRKFIDLYGPEYILSTLEEKFTMLQIEPENSTEKIAQDEHYFRLYGPINVFHDNRYRDEDDPCAKYGGCRMLTCNDFATEEDDTFGGGEGADVGGSKSETAFENSSKGADWFIGVCQECHKKIEKKHYALRVPQLDGGWKGCYCSFTCLEVDTEELDTFSDRMRTQLEKIGIYDR